MKKQQLASTTLALLVATLGLTSCSDPQETAIEKLTGSGYAFDVNDFHRASASGDLAAIELFLQSGMAVDAPDASGRTALLVAATAGRPRISKHLLSLGASTSVVDPDGRTPLIHAASTGDVSLVQGLLDSGADPAVKDRSQWSALTEAAFHGKSEAVALLAPVSRPFLDGALHLACVGGDVPTIDTLIRAGASVFTRSREEKTALMYASANGHPDAVKLLIHNGANRYALDGKGRTSADLAKLAGHKTITDYLNEVPSEDEISPADSVFVLNGNETPGAIEEEAASDADPEEAVVASSSGSAESEEDIAAVKTETVEEGKSKVTKRKDSVMARTQAATQTPGPVSLGALKGKARIRPPAEKSNPVGPSPLKPLVKEEAPAPARSAPVKKDRVVRTRRLDGVVLQRSLAAIAPANATAAVDLHPAPAINMYDYRESQLPFLLSGVQVDNGGLDSRTAQIRLLNDQEAGLVTVTPGQMVGDTGLRVVDIQSHLTRTKQGRGALVDVSRMIVEDPESGARHLVVKDLPAMSNDVFAVVSLGGGENEVIYDARSEDRFTAAGGEESYRILDVRPNQVVIEREDTRETFTIPRTTHSGR